MLNKKYRLFEDYNSRSDSINYIDGHDSLDGIIYQPYVYLSAFELVKRTKAKYIIDIGCGDGKKILKIKDYVEDCKIIMIDHQFIIENITTKYDFAEYIAADFDAEIPYIDNDILQEAVVVCSDVIEHLRNPAVLLEFFGRIKTKVKGIVISTPDRVQERGLFDYGPPANPYHVMEWSLDEFCRLLNDYGFTNRIHAGLTVSNNLVKAKATLVIISSKYIDYPPENNTLYKIITAPRLSFNNDVYNFLKKTLPSKSNDIDTNSWYIFSEENEELTTANLRVDVDDIISLADANGFEIIKKTNVEISNKTDSIWHGYSYLHINDNGESIAALKGGIIKKILDSKRSNDILSEARFYPFNLVSKKKYENRQTFFNFFKRKDTLKLARWHDCIIRKDFMLELLFGTSFYEE